MPTVQSESARKMAAKAAPRQPLDKTKRARNSASGKASAAPAANRAATAANFSGVCQPRSQTTSKALTDVTRIPQAAPASVTDSDGNELRACVASRANRPGRGASSEAGCRSPVKGAPLPGFGDKPGLGT